MLMLALRTDKPDSELYLYEDSMLLDKIIWSAHRQLAETLHKKIDELLSKQSLSLQSLHKIGVYGGPGSFTGLRIGLSVANTLSYALQIPIVGATGDAWLDVCVRSEGDMNPVIPQYGADPHITKQKK